MEPLIVVFTSKVVTFPMSTKMAPPSNPSLNVKLLLTTSISYNTPPQYIAPPPCSLTVKLDSVYKALFPINEEFSTV